MTHHDSCMSIDEFRNFLERIHFKPRDEDHLKERMKEICYWASYRGQTLTRTVRGMMYYRRALEIQCLQDTIDPGKINVSIFISLFFPICVYLYMF
jgi:hypothetical protein